MSEMKQDSYVIAVRRDARSNIAADWQQALQQIEGLSLVGSANPSRVQVEASPAAIECVRQMLDGMVHVEPLIRHKTS